MRVEEIEKFVVSVGIKADARPEDVGVKEWCKLAVVLNNEIEGLLDKTKEIQTLEKE